MITPFADYDRTRFRELSPLKDFSCKVRCLQVISLYDIPFKVRFIDENLNFSLTDLLRFNQTIRNPYSINIHTPETIEMLWKTFKVTKMAKGPHYEESRKVPWDNFLLSIQELPEIIRWLGRLGYVAPILNPGDVRQWTIVPVQGRNNLWLLDYEDDLLLFEPTADLKMVNVTRLPHFNHGLSDLHIRTAMGSRVHTYIEMLPNVFKQLKRRGFTPVMSLIAGTKMALRPNTAKQNHYTGYWDMVGVPVVVDVWEQGKKLYINEKDVMKYCSKVLPPTLRHLVTLPEGCHEGAFEVSILPSLLGEIVKLEMVCHRDPMFKQHFPTKDDFSLPLTQGKKVSLVQQHFMTDTIRIYTVVGYDFYVRCEYSDTLMEDAIIIASLEELNPEIEVGFHTSVEFKESSIFKEFNLDLYPMNSHEMHPHLVGVYIIWLGQNELINLRT